MNDTPKRLGRPAFNDGFTRQTISVRCTPAELDAVLDGLTARERMEAMLATINETPAANYCEHCLKTEGLIWGPNPYAHEVFDDNTPMWLCQECRQELADDI